MLYPTRYQPHKLYFLTSSLDHELLFKQLITQPLLNFGYKSINTFVN